MTRFQNILIDTAMQFALYWRQENCKEGNADCYKYLFENKYESVLKEDWCQATTSAIIQKACERAGIRNPFKWTLSTVNFFKQAQQIGIADGTPNVGSCFFHYRDGGTTQGHTGTIVGMSQNGLFTVEGNSSNALKCFGCEQLGQNSSVVIIGDKTARSFDAMAKKGAVYVHTERIPAIVGADDPEESDGPSPGVIEAGISWPAALLLAGAAVGAYFMVKKAA